MRWPAVLCLLFAAAALLQFLGVAWTAAVTGALLPVALAVHVIGYFACLREPRIFDLWLTKVSRCPRVRNWKQWGCNSYAP